MTIAMLSWGAEETLKNTLYSYKYHGWLNDDEQKIIVLQEGTSYQESLARGFGFEPITLPYNVGIARAYRILLNKASEPYFLFLENDWELLHYPEPELGLARDMLHREVADIVRLRSRENPGSPLWSRQFEGNELSRPEYLLDSIHWIDRPTWPQFKILTYPYYIYENEEVISKESIYYLTDSRYANWTNNPHMGRTTWLREYIAPRLGEGNLEKDIQAWWQNHQFKVAQGEGLFTHRRLD